MAAQRYNPDKVLTGGALYGTVKDGITKAGFTIDFTIDDLAELRLM